MGLHFSLVLNWKKSNIANAGALNYEIVGQIVLMSNIKNIIRLIVVKDY